MSNLKVLVFGSNGLVGNSVSRILNDSSKVGELYLSQRSDTDLEEKIQIEKKISEVKPDIIINCAAKVGGIYANNTYRTDFLIKNLKINLNLIESIKDIKDLKLINLGSSCIYPLNAPDPIKESSFLDGKLEPTNSPYALGKIIGIELGKEISNEFGNEVINLMPTNMYGPFDNFTELDSHVIPGLIHRMHLAKENKDSSFEIWGTGSPLREFMYVDDLGYAIEFLLDKKVNDNLINVGTGEEISVMNLAIKIKEIIGYKGEISNDLDKPDGNPRKLLDSSLINSMGWKSQVILDDGLVKTYDWYRSNI